MIGLLKRQTARKAPAATVAGNALRSAETVSIIPEPLHRHSNAPSQTSVETPIHAMSRAADVRIALAGRLTTMLPRLAEDKQSMLYAYVVQALGAIALDEILKIRLALNSTLKDYACVPPKQASELVKLVERDVTEPVLRFCAGVSDHDLADLLRAHPAPWADRVIIETNSGNLPAPPEALQSIVLRARDISSEISPDTAEMRLPQSLGRELSNYIDASVKELLIQHGGFDRATTEDIANVFRRRLNRVKGENTSRDFSDETITDALALRDTTFVVDSLARKLGISLPLIRQIIQSQSAKSIIVICWRAGLSMRTALALQRDLALISPSRLIYPRGGSDYPFSDGELRWHAEFLGV